MRSKTIVPTGYVLYETESIVVIATVKSKNRKTANMIQIWILNRHESPIDSVRNGSDANICFDCPHRGEGFKKRTCYVNVAQGPNSIWKAYRRNRYPFLPMEQYAKVFTGRVVRFGAYGEPVLIPTTILQAIVGIAPKWTGYTHQWRKFSEYRPYLMASCDSVQDSAEAMNAGWRTFRVRTGIQSVLRGEIVCPASPEAGHRTTCEQCGLCNGARENDARKNIVIIAHGSGAKNFVGIDQIGQVA